MPQHPEFLSSFGRNRGRALRPYQQSLLETLLPQLAPPYVHGAGGDKAIRDWADALPWSNFKKAAIEIGFGGGEHLLAQAEHNTDTLFIGCEPYINGMAKCLAGIDQLGLKNIRLATYDARRIIQALPDDALDSAFILFPDPWPKARQNKRRLLNQETLGLLARAHKPGGRLLIATDHEDYKAWILEHLAATPHYTWLAREKADWATPPADWTETKYQRKTTEQGRDPLFMECQRNLRAMP